MEEVDETCLQATYDDPASSLIIPTASGRDMDRGWLRRRGRRDIDLCV